MPPDGGAGILFVPETLGSYAKGDAEFTEALMKAMTEPLADPSSAGSTLPFIVRAPATAIGSMRVVPLGLDPWDEFVNGG